MPFHPSKCRRRSFILFSLLLGSSITLARPAIPPADMTGDADSALLKFSEIEQDPLRRAAAYAAGEERVLLCGHCHGTDGNARREGTPNLAQQHPLYLFRQFEKFASGERTDYVMSSLAKSLSEEEKVNIAVYYAGQTVKGDDRAAGDTARGERLYQATCAACHGPDAHGQRDMPRIAGQPATYLENALKRFRTQDPATATSPMVTIASMLSAEETDALIRYLASRP